MFNFFKKNDAESVALSVEPYLRLKSVGKEVRVTIDSGEEDFNHKSSQFRLDEQQSRSFEGLVFEGFDVIYTCMTPPPAKEVLLEDAGSDNLSEKFPMKEGVEGTLVKEKIDAGKRDNSRKDVCLDLETLHKQLISKEDYARKALEREVKEAFEYDEGIVMGEVFLELADGELYSIAKPIYNIIPEEVDGAIQFVDIEDISDYVQEQWSEEFSTAIMLLDGSDEAGHISPVSNRVRREDEDSTLIKGVPNDMLKYGVIGAAIALVSTMAFSSIQNMGEDKADNSSTGGYSINAALNNLGGGNTSASSSNSYSSDPNRIPTPEEYATLQTEATNNLLARMNIDVNEPADLGCLTE